MLLSIVSPEYKGASMVPELVRRIKESVSTITEEYEIILVNDGSPDDSWNAILRECETDSRVKGLDLSRNFGQHYAISAGLANATGEWIVVMDCDLQDRPEEIPRLYEKALEGWDIVYARRVVRKDSFFKRLSSELFHFIFDRLSGYKTDKAIANFGIYSSQVISEYNKMPEKARSFDGLIRFLGFSKSFVDVVHSQRAEGNSSYSIKKLLSLSFDLMISNTNKPLKIAVTWGVAMSVISTVLALYNLVAKIAGIIKVDGYTTTVFSIWFIGGMLLAMLGILGLYIDKIFTQVKDRPLYVVKRKINFNE